MFSDILDSKGPLGIGSGIEIPVEIGTGIGRTV